MHVRLLTALCLALVFLSAESRGQALKNTDVFNLEIGADPQVSPDGRHIVYTRTAMDIMTDRPVRNLWIVDSDGSNHRPLASGRRSSSNPRWSPSGNRIAYISADDNGAAQLHVRWLDSGDTAVLTNVRKTPQAVSWSPDGKQLAFTMFVPDANAPLATPPAQPKGAQWAPGARVIKTLPYRSDGNGFLETGYSHVFMLPAEGGTPRQLTAGQYNHSGPVAWSADGKTLYFSAHRNEDAEHDPVESELWALAIDSGELTVLTDRDGPDFAPALSPNGRQLAYLGFDDEKKSYHQTAVYLMDLATGATRKLSDLDRSIGAVRWSSNSQLIVSFQSLGRVHFGRMGLQGRIRSITDEVGGLSIGRPYTSGSFSVAENGAIAFTRGTPYRPADIAVARRGGVETLTQLNEDALGNMALGNVEAISWLSSLGDYTVDGWLVTPPNFDPDKQYPLILEIHGGPHAAYGPHFSAEVQLFAAAGYVVLYSNPRGSTSYGKDFALEIHHNYPANDYDDLMDGVDAVIARGFVDADQLFVTGGSGGGVLTAWIVGKTDRFRAAVVAKPVINWTSFVLTADGSHYFSRYWFADMPWENPESYWTRSPLSLVGNVTTPTALLTGEADYRTPMSETEQYYQALKLRKVDTVMVRIPEASHGIAGRPSQLIAKVDNILAWFERYR